MQNWITLTTKETYKNPWIRVREDAIIHPNGKQGIYGVVEIPPGIFVVPIRDNGDILLIKQKHYPTGLESWELPGGGLKENYTLEEQAQEELQEESGYQAMSFLLLGKTQTQPGITTQLDNFYLAQGLTEISNTKTVDQQHAEGISHAQFFSSAEVNNMIMEGLINHGQTITGLYLHVLRSQK